MASRANGPRAPVKGAWGHWFLLCPRCDGRGASDGEIRCPACENWGWLDLGTTAPVAGGTVQRRMSEREVEDWKARIARMEQQLFESRLDQPSGRLSRLRG